MNLRGTAKALSGPSNDLYTDDPFPAALRLQGEGKMQDAIVGVVWPQIAGLISAMILLFTLGYVVFQRQEVRA